tara:strand:- start:1473 stop:1751 length:279 start_codon:yes stop_codon:yes gene_type:complete
MSKRTYKEQLIKLGLNEVDGAYDISYAVEKCHEAFTLLSDHQRFIIEGIWGTKFIKELERFGRYTDKQSNLTIVRFNKLGKDIHFVPLIDAE